MPASASRLPVSLLYLDTSQPEQPTQPNRYQAILLHLQRQELPALLSPSGSQPGVLPDNLRLSDSSI